MAVDFANYDLRIGRGASDQFDGDAGALLDLDYFTPSSGGGVNVDLSVSDTADTLASDATITSQSGLIADLSIADSADTLAAGALVTVGISLAVTDSDDSLSSGAGVQVGIALAVTDSADTLAAAVGVVVLANAAATDTADSLASDATVVPLAGGVVCTLEVTDTADTLESTATITDAEAEAPVSLGGNNKLFDVPTRRVYAALSVTDDNDTLYAVAQVAKLVQAAQVKVAKLVNVGASLSVVDDSDTLQSHINGPWPEIKLLTVPRTKLVSSRYEEVA